MKVWLLNIGNLLLFIAKAISETEFECTGRDVDPMYPCGNPKRYRKLTGQWVPEYRHYFDICYGAMSDRSRLKTWPGARKHCQAMGGDLIVLTDRNLDNLVRIWISGHNRNYHGGRWYHLGAIQWHGEGPYFWLDNTMLSYRDDRWYDKVRGTIFPHHFSAGGGKNKRRCVSYFLKRKGTVYGYQNVRCDATNTYVCEIPSTPAYYTQYRFEIISFDSQRSTTSFEVGEKFQILCASRDLYPLELRVIYPTGRVQSLFGDRPQHVNLSSLQVYQDLSPDPKYLGRGTRCFPYYNITLHLNANLRLDGLRLDCFSSRPGFRSRLKMLHVKSAPLRPLIAIDSRPFSTTRRRVTLYVSDLVAYSCIARLGSGTIMTIGLMNLINHDLSWGRTYDTNNRYREHGAFHDLRDVKTVHGRDDWWSGNYINLTLNFVARRNMSKQHMVCYSRDVLQKLQDGRLSHMDEHGIWCRLHVTASTQRPTLSVHTVGDRDGRATILYDCDEAKISCSGPVGWAGSLTLTIVTESSVFDWNSKRKQNNNLPTWLYVTDVTSYPDRANGITVTVKATILITSDVAGVGLIVCEAREAERAFQDHLQPIYVVHACPQKVDLKLLNTHKSHDGKMTIYGCDTIHVSCEAPREFAESIVIALLLQGTPVVLGRSDSSNTLPQWVTNVTAIDKANTHTSALTAELYVTPAMAKITNIVCQAKLALRTLQQPITTSFLFLYGSTPPELEVEGGDRHIVLNCTSGIGMGDTQTIQLIDFNLRDHFWYVSTSGYVTGETRYPWLDIQMVEKSWNETCGQIIVSMVSISLLPLKRGATIVCHSYDTREEVVSSYSKGELRASQDISCDNCPDDTLDEDSSSLWLIFFFSLVATAVLFFLVMIVLRRRLELAAGVGEEVKTKAAASPGEQFPVSRSLASKSADRGVEFDLIDLSNELVPLNATADKRYSVNSEIRTSYNYDSMRPLRTSVGGKSTKSTKSRRFGSFISNRLFPDN